ncbi:MAG: ABC transporter ATP-binding protein/permease [Solobacterium sp.]|nr:ABC transporter ATP-binding protein/permease [Solobacterium sp.]
MLQIRDICKEYRTGSLVQKALDHVSLNLRDNEFVAILGPSGSGKTTLLNIVGGLDRYDSGDLIINGISTKKYKDRDWDSYRNHTIGFVFQSYNLIPHQTVLANVELALTISGISGSERRRRAQDALRKVGLGDQMHKKPAQMSGGQMQRVAIARALVNDPDILLADEPTGALDTETSIQVMDLLKEVASDRLVVMVTHNPELAEQYATRIVNLKDGKIIGDSDPFIVDDADTAPPVHKNMGRSSMSFLTALALSFNNLRTKLTRTILVAFAGSIGIIGIALIMSLSNGVNQYIKNIEEETLLEYPLEIQNSSVSLNAFLEMPETEEKEDANVKERRIASSLFSRVSANDLASLKDYFEGPDSHIYNYAKAIEYTYNVTPLIYRVDEEEKTVRQVNPDKSFDVLGFNSSSFMLSSMRMDIFRALPKDTALFRDSYDVMAGHWPQNYNECVLVISQSGRVSDLVLYTLGLKDAEELDKMLESFSAGESVKDAEGPLRVFRYDEFLGITFKLVDHYAKYVYDSEYEVWTDKSEDKKYIYDLAVNGEDLKIVGVVQPREDASVTMLQGGIYYPESLVVHMIENSRDSRITQLQLADPSQDVFTGKGFNEDREDTSLNLETLFQVDTEALNRVFSFDSSKMTIDSSVFANLDMSDMDMSGLIDPNALSGSMPGVSEEELMKALSQIEIEVNSKNLMEMFKDILEGYQEYASKDPSTDYEKLGAAVWQYLQTEEARELLAKDLTEIIRNNELDTLTNEYIQNLVTQVMSGYTQYVITEGKDPENFDENMQEYLATPEAQAIINEQLTALFDDLAAHPIPQEEMDKLTKDLTDGYQSYAEENSLPEPEKLLSSFQKYLQTEDGKERLTKGIESSVNTKKLEKSLSEALGSMFSGIAGSLGEAIASGLTSFMEQFAGKIETVMTTAVEQIASNMNDAFSIHPEEFAKAISMNMDEQELSELLTSLMSKQPASYESNLKLLGYADVRKPYTITIYPRDFEGKGKIIEILDAYNERMRFLDEEKVITYTDTVGLLMSSVTDIINAISYVLIAFVAISLVVSSIMIGVITYISVLERRKEIGILRAIGASKRNVSSVFNAETFIIGLLAGLFGIGITLLLLIPGNMLIHHLTDADIWARLPVTGAVTLVILSVVLTLIGGLLPSRKAAKSDPVAALRSE